MVHKLVHIVVECGVPETFEVPYMRQLQRLSAAKVRTLSEPGQYSDGNGLTLRVEPTGSKRWVQRVTPTRKTS